MGRATQGVRLIKLNDEDEIASIAKIEDVKEEDLPEIDGAIVTEESSTENLGGDSENTDNQEDSATNL
jgi:DNA gyrase subunit A